MDLSTLSTLAGIVLIDLVLSGDNALVIGMAVRALPGQQRKWGIVGGAVAAITLRVTFTALAAFLFFNFAGLRLIGGLLLLWIATKLLVAPPAEGSRSVTGKSLIGAIRIILIADVVMSLDNILAVAGASHGRLELLVFGLALSIPLLMGGAALVAHVLNRLPWLVWLGGAVIAWVAGGMIVDDPLLRDPLDGTLPALQWLIPVGLLLAVVIGSYFWRPDAREA